LLAALGLEKCLPKKAGRSWEFLFASDHEKKNYLGAATTFSDQEV